MLSDDANLTAARGFPSESGPVKTPAVSGYAGTMSNLEAQPEFEQLQPGQLCTSVEVHDPRPVPLGGLRAMTVYRTLPLKQRSLIGAWCFIDHYGPDDVAETGGMKVARHPHTGLATVSWLFEGAVNHLDSGGVAARVKPGELNLMLAGRGITHQELSTDDTRTLHGVQLWYALPDAERHGDNGFEHYAPEPLKLDGGEALVFIGELGGSKSPVNPRTTELFGAEVRIRPNATVKLDIQRDFEYGLSLIHI